MVLADWHATDSGVSENLYAPPQSDLADGRFSSPVLVAPTVVEAIGRAFRIFFEHLGAILKLVLAIGGPVYLLKAGLYAVIPETVNESFLRLLDLLDAAVNAVIIPSVVYLAAESARTNRRPALRTALGWGLRASGHVFLAGMIAGIVSGIATCLLVIPGIYVAIRLGLVEACAGLRGRTRNVLESSWASVDGRWWKTFGALTGMGMLVYVPLILAGVAFGALTVAVEEDVMGGLAWLAPWMEPALIFLVGLFESLVRPLLVLVGLVLYLSYRHGGIDAGEDDWVEELGWVDPA